ncbi:MAG: phosphotriesterase-related protein [Chloroflexi bacterium]|nr:phosphotriesterase-related protein [Chloroflexota bacterium]
MANSAITGKAQTVLGPVDPQDLGVVLPHEHLLFDFSVTFSEPDAASEKLLAYQPITLENVGWLRMNHDKHRDNVRLLDEDVAVSELAGYQREGGRTVIEVTPRDQGRDPAGLQRIARATGLNIVMGTSYYVARAHPRELEDWTERQIADQFIADVTVGAEGGARAGLIGEIGCSWPLAKREIKVLRAGAVAQRATGAPLMVHPGPDESAPAEIVQVLRDAGADLTRTIMCHMPRTLFRRESRLKLAETGCYLEWDAFGRGSYYYAWGTFTKLYNRAPIVLADDPRQFDDIQDLIAAGYLKQILLSHDVCFKMQMARYGGYGYGYLLRYGVPLMRIKGMTDAQINTIMVENPARLLRFVPPG